MNGVVVTLRLTAIERMYQWGLVAAEGCRRDQLIKTKFGHRALEKCRLLTRRTFRIQIEAYTALLRKAIVACTVSLVVPILCIAPGIYLLQQIKRGETPRTKVGWYTIHLWL